MCVCMNVYSWHTATVGFLLSTELKFCSNVANVCFVPLLFPPKLKKKNISGSTTRAEALCSNPKQKKVSPSHKSQQCKNIETPMRFLFAVLWMEEKRSHNLSNHDAPISLLSFWTLMWHSYIWIHVKTTWWESKPLQVALFQSVFSGTFRLFTVLLMIENYSF